LIFEWDPWEHISMQCVLLLSTAKPRKRMNGLTERSLYPIQKITEIYNKITEMYKKVTELEISSWNVLFLLRSEVAYIGTEPILPSKRSFVFLIYRSFEGVEAPEGCENVA
jgi:hypothetical protein